MTSGPVARGTTSARCALLCLAALAAAASNALAQTAVTLTASDGVTLSAQFHEAPVTPAPAVVLVHVLGGNRDSWLPVVGRLQEAGMSALAIDLRGHGHSSGSSAIAVDMARDVMAAVAWLGTQPSVRPGAVAVVGASLGASLALIAAADLPAVRGVVLISPAAEYRGVRLDAAARKYGARPMLLLGSQQDPYALRTMRELAPPEQTSREQQVSSATAHGTKLLDQDPQMVGALVDWLRRTLLS